MQLAQRQKIFADVASLAECAAPKHKARVLQVIDRVRQELRPEPSPEDKRLGPKSDEHRAKIAAAFEDRRRREVFKIDRPDTSLAPVEVVGIDNLAKLTGFAINSIRVKFSAGRGRFAFVYKGVELMAVRTSTFAEAPSDEWQKGLDALIRG